MLVALAAGTLVALTGVSAASGVAQTPATTATPAPSASPSTVPSPSPTTSGSPSPTAVPAPRSTPAPLPACAYGDAPTRLRAFDDWGRTLLDTTFRLPAAYAPPDLVPVSRASLAGSGQVRRLVIADLSDLAHAARTAGVPLAAVSGYRSYSSQAWSFAYWIGVLGYARALLGSARAGHSEHQLGTTLDFASYPGGEPWYFSWYASRTATWLATNGWRFGFVMSYPPGKMALTCYGYEPWHFRYVGRDAAAEIHASGLTLRQYLWRSRTTPPSRTAEDRASARAVPAPAVDRRSFVAD